MRIVLADDSVLFREGMARLLTEAGHEVTGQAATGDELHRHVENDQPDLAIVDIRMPPTHTVEGLVAAQRIRVEHPATAVLVLSQYVESDYAFSLLSTGMQSAGYLLKDSVTAIPTFLDAVQRVAHGEVVVDPSVVTRLLARRRSQDPLDRLTARERDVLALMAEGCSNQTIGDRLALSERTIEAHVHAIFTKLDLAPAAEVHRRVLAVLAFLRAPDAGLRANTE